MQKVGSYQAKTHLPQLLARVEAGETIVITRHGKEIAVLGPTANVSAKPVGFAQSVAAWRKTRKSVKLGGLPVRELINQGRR